MRADLHMHSTASDGQFSPTELVRRAQAAGITVMALTDHDSTQGCCEAQKEAARLGICLLPGVELGCSTEHIKEIHVLGYGVDPQDSALCSFCIAWRQKREARAEAMVRRLCEAGKPIDMARVREMAKGVIARPHVARALVEAGHATSVKDAFEKYLTPGRCGYVPREKLSVQDAVRMIAAAGGVSVLAHPMEMRMSQMNVAALIREWKAQGLCGIEVYHPSADAQDVRFLHALAREEGMLVTGGSDYHGEDLRRGRIGQETDRWTTMEEDVRALQAAIAAQKERVKRCRA